MTACVFASSSDSVDARYLAVASELGVLLAKAKIDVVFGGGGIGLMNSLANAVINNDGKITGVIPHFMKEAGWGHPDVKDMIFTGDMSERKRTMFSLSDSIIALPGGMGTLEDLTEALTLRQLNLFNGPIIILNTLDFYKPLFEFFDEMIDGRFMRADNRKMWKIASTPEEALEYLTDKQTWIMEPVIAKV